MITSCIHRVRTAGIPLGFFTFALIPLGLSAAIKVEEQVVGPAPGNISSYCVSPGGVSVASLTMKGSRSLVVVDGQEGPPVDELLTGTGSPSLTCVGAVLFSPDGKTHVYAARIGDHYIIVKDGKEIYRGTYAHLAFQGGDGQLTLAPNGKHVSWLEKVENSPSEHGWRLVVDGKPGPLSSNNNSFRLFFSPDGSRWAYVATKLGGKRDESFMVVDGKEMPFVSSTLRFTADNKLIVAAPSADGTWSLQGDGKTVVKGVVDGSRRVWVAPTGSKIAAALRKTDGTMELWVDGQEVSAGDRAKDIVDVTFSPDGKRYIATCQTSAASFAVVDGKKGLEYRIISYPTFTRDSSKALYVATSGGKNFVVTDGQESDGFEILGGQYVKIALPNQGSRFAYSTGDGMNRTFSFIADGKPVPLNNKSPAADSLAFSADGSRYAFVAAPVGRSEITTLVVDGQEVADMYPQTIVNGAPNTAQREKFFIFSPDGKYIAQTGMNGAKQKRGLYINSKLVYATERGVSRAAFTPDSKHFVFASSVPGKGTPVPAMAWFVDGELAVEIPGYPWEQSGTWEMGADGVYQFVTAVGGDVKKFRITPSAEGNVDTMISQAQERQAKAEADALAAQKQAEADKLAAAQKAKADADAAAAKRKAAFDAAAAAKTKARQDAVDAKNHTRQKR